MIMISSKKSDIYFRLSIINNISNLKNKLLIKTLNKLSHSIVKRF